MLTYQNINERSKNIFIIQFLENCMILFHIQQNKIPTAHLNSKYYQSKL